MKVRERVVRWSVPALAWGAALAGVILARRAALRPSAAAGLLAAAMNAVALLAGWAVSARRIPRPVRDSLGYWLVVASAPLFVAVALSGGLRSPAVLVTGFVALGAAWRYSLARGAFTAAIWLALLVAADRWLGRTIDQSWLVAVAFALFAIALIPIAYVRRAVHEEAKARQKLARVEGYLADRRMTPLSNTPVGTPTDLRSERQAQFQTAEGLRHIDAMDRYLRDVRDMMSADEVVFWRFNEVRQTQRAAAWSTENASAPRYFDRDKWSNLVRWAAESGQVQCIFEDNVAYFVVAPVHDGGRVHGALSISSKAGLLHTPEGAKRWTARHATHASVLLDLLDLRREASRHLLSMPALVKAAERLQAAKTTETLGTAICQTAVEVTSAHRSALVRWDAEQETGAVMAVSRGHRLQPGLAIDGDSVVAEQCAMRRLLHLDDARTLRRAVIYGGSDQARELGGLAIVPLARAETGVIGAIVIESDEADAITRREVENIVLLGVIAARSLETAWEIEEESKRARTDQLTGLSNRRHFDEQFARIIGDALAHGTPASIVIGDIDHFKRVNDTFGHEAGDAVLRAVSKVFMGCVRAEDVCSRYGGEEIAILLPETTVARAAEVAERVRKAIEARPVEFDGKRIVVSASFGVAGYPESTAIRDGVFAAADRALYEAKGRGRNQVRVALGPPNRGQPLPDAAAGD